MTILVAINDDGQYERFKARRGDTVAFTAAVDTVICIENHTIFGSSRFLVSGGQTLRLRVQVAADAMATQGQFDCFTFVGSFDTPCSELTGRRVTPGGEVDPPGFG